MATIGKLVITLVTRSAKFRSGLEKAAKRTKTFRVSIVKAARKVAKFATALSIGAATALAVFVAKSMGAIDKLAKTADKLGMTTEALVGFRHAAKLSGVEANTFDMAIQRMTRRLAEAGQGTGEALGALKELGLNTEQLAKMAPDQAFMDIADAMAKVENQADRVRLSFKLFDSEGVALVNTLAMGREGLEKVAAETANFGTALTRVDAARVEAANDAITRAKELFGGLIRQLTVKLAPMIEEIAKRFTSWGIEGATAAGRVEQGIKKAIPVIGFFMDVWRTGRWLIKAFSYGIQTMVINVLKNIKMMLWAVAKLPAWLGGGKARAARAGLDKMIGERTAALDKLGDELDTLVDQPRGAEQFEQFMKNAARRRERLEEEAAKTATAGAGADLPKAAATAATKTAEFRQVRSIGELARGPAAMAAIKTATPEVTELKAVVSLLRTVIQVLRRPPDTTLRLGSQ